MNLLTSDEINLLSRIGFIAISQRDKTRALAIFSLLKQLRPDHSLPIIGIALTWIGMKEPIYAVKLLEKTVLRDIYEQYIVLIYLGLALMLDKKYKESRRILNTVIKEIAEKIKLNNDENLTANSSVLQAYEMGKELLGEINKHHLI